MPKILITGNGFDLNFNLPTTYSDFIKILTYIESSNDYNFESIFSNLSNFNIIEKSFNNKLEFDLVQIDSLKNEIKNNLWFQFFKNELNIETWIDFENKINYVLKLFLTSIPIINQNFFDKSPLGKKLFIYESTALNNNIEIINVLSFFNIILKDHNSNWSFLSEFLINKYDYYISLDVQKIVDSLYQQLIEFKNIFNKYFTIFVIPLYEKNNIKIDSQLLKSINYYFTFNYTPTFESFFQTRIKANYLHGKINSEVNSIVLGINEVPEDVKIEKIFFLPFTKYYQKLNNNTDYYFLDEITQVSKKSSVANYEFYFWGHSLDRSDEDYINEIFDFVTNSNSKIKTINVIYHNETSKSKLILNLLDIRGKNDIVNKMRKKELMFYKSDSEELRKALNKNNEVRMYSSSPTVH